MVGIFDSGFGGLAIFKEIAKLLPTYNYVYLGDSARTPYGNRSQEIIYKFTEEAVDFLFKQGCQLIIIACGTASAEALRKIQQEYLPKHYPQRRVSGIIKPLVEEAIKTSRFGRIGVAGTKSTIDSGAYEKELKKLQITNYKLQINSKFQISNSEQVESLEIYQQACPLLVPLVEEGWIKKPETRMILKKYLRPLKEKKIDTLILGCTHYPLLYKEFVRIMGKRCNVLDSGKIVAASLKDYLVRHSEIETKLERGSKKVFYTTDNAANFSDLGSSFFGKKIKAEKVEL